MAKAKNVVVAAPVAAEDVPTDIRSDIVEVLIELFGTDFGGNALFDEFRQSIHQRLLDTVSTQVAATPDETSLDVDGLPVTNPEASPAVLAEMTAEEAAAAPALSEVIRPPDATRPPSPTLAPLGVE